MTPQQTVEMVRMLLDEARDDYVNINQIQRAINEAQIKKVRSYYQLADERALRPFYVSATSLSNGDIIQNASNVSNVLYPRSCRIYRPGANRESLSSNSRAQTIMAKYLAPSRYFNYVQNPLSGYTGMTQAYSGDRFPRAAYYTIKRETNNGVYQDKIYFIYDPANPYYADIWYLDYPQQFVYVDQTPANSVSLQLPSEYHVEVALLAAEILNDIDVNEQERGAAVFQNQRLEMTTGGL